MTPQPNNTTEMTLPSDTDILFTRIFNAPRTLVWKAYSQAEHLKNWWGPEGWTLPVCELDFKPGGKWVYAMQSPDGEMSHGGATYQEIVEPERIVYVDYFTDDKGNPLPDFPEAHITITFTESDGKTIMSCLTRYNTREERDAVLQMGVEQGFTETLDRLVKYLPHIA